MNASGKRDEGPTVIKKYANRRLYDTGRSSYVTLEDLCVMVKEGRDFVVYDAKTNEDLTRSVLTQIIVEQEGKEGQTMLPTNFLRQLIGLYGDSLQGLVPNYLEQSLGAFTKNQEQFRAQLEKSLSGMMTNPVSALEEISRNNIEMFQSALRAWSPFGAPGASVGGGPGRDKDGGSSSDEARLRELKKAASDLQKEIDRLSRKA